MRGSRGWMGAFLWSVACSPGASNDLEEEEGQETGSDSDTEVVEDSGSPIDSGDVASLTGVPPQSPIGLPDFVARNRDGSERGPNDLRDVRTVMWFYPLANTAG